MLIHVGCGSGSVPLSCGKHLKQNQPKTEQYLLHSNHGWKHAQASMTVQRVERENASSSHTGMIPFPGSNTTMMKGNVLHDMLQDCSACRNKFGAFYFGSRYFQNEALKTHNLSTHHHLCPEEVKKQNELQPTKLQNTALG